MKRAVCLCAILAMGCSTASKDIASAYVSPMQYQTYDCEQFALGGANEQEMGCPAVVAPGEQVTSAPQTAVAQPVSGGSTVPASALEQQ